MSDRDGPSNFSELLNQQVKSPSDDKYDIKNFGDVQKESRLRIKWNRIKTTLFGDSGVSGKFVQGVMMGAMVGGVAGTLFGLVSFLQHRKFIYVPLVALSMSVSFGFFMGVGTVIRSDERTWTAERLIISGDKVLVLPPEWMEKYRKP